MATIIRHTHTHMLITHTPTLTITRIIALTFLLDTMAAIIGATDIDTTIAMRVEAIGIAVTGDLMGIAGPVQTAGGDMRSRRVNGEPIRSLPDKVYVRLEVSRPKKAKRAPARTSTK